MRPNRGTSLAAIQIALLPDNNRLSVSETIAAPTIGPVPGVSLYIITPFPFLPWSGNSSKLVFFPYPYFVNTANCSFLFIIGNPTNTSSSSASFIALIPDVALPIAETSQCAKEHLQLRDWLIELKLYKENKRWSTNHQIQMLKQKF